MHITPYSNYTDEELLAKADKAIPYSPLITELCGRLEKASQISPDASPRAECPACEAALLIEYDAGNELFEVKLQKD